MRIGEFSRKYNLPISSVRHYITLGILMPKRNGHQFHFDIQDHEDMKIVNQLKCAGFSLKEINAYINTRRSYDPNDDAKSPRLISMLQAKERNILAEKQVLNENLRAITQMIEEQAKEYAANFTDPSIGIHVGFLDYMACPQCGKSLHLENARISHSRIISGSLTCSCGYTATIEEGFLFTDIENDLDEDSQFFEDYFGDDQNASYDSAFFESINNASPEFLAIQHRVREWISNTIRSRAMQSKIILVPDVSAQFLYLYHKNPCFEDSLIILTVLSKKSADAIHDHLLKLGASLKIAVIVSPDCKLPLKKACADLLIDYLGSYSYSFYKTEPYIAYVSEHLSDYADIVGGIDYFDRASKSVKIINSTYRNSVRPHLDYKRYKKILADKDFSVVENELIGSCRYSGHYFEYHVTGEPRYSHAYYAKRNRSKE